MRSNPGMFRRWSDSRLLFFACVAFYAIALGAGWLAWEVLR